MTNSSEQKYFYEIVMQYDTPFHFESNALASQSRQDWSGFCGLTPSHTSFSCHVLSVINPSEVIICMRE